MIFFAEVILSTLNHPCTHTRGLGTLGLGLLAQQWVLLHTTALREVTDYNLDLQEKPPSNISYWL